MGTDLNSLSPAALAAAMRGGTDGWGQVASASENVRYCEALPKPHRRKCRCGCGGKTTHAGKANGMALTSGCELVVRRWVKTGRRAAAAIGAGETTGETR